VYNTPLLIGGHLHHFKNQRCMDKEVGSQEI
jgi:hypothetical protein